MLRQYNDLFRVIFLLLGLLAFGTMGYRFFEGWGWFDSLYMTVITLATVGFREIGPMDTAGRAFTIVLIMGGVSVLGYGATKMTSFVVEGRLNEILRGRRMEKVIGKLDGHYIVCGYGRIGTVVTAEFVESGVPVVVVDHAEHPEGIIVGEYQVPLIVGDATDEEVLLSAGIERAKGLVAALPGDAENIMATLVARDLNMDLVIVARAVTETCVSKLYRAGATNVVSPYELGARRMASTVLRPFVVDFLDVMMHAGDAEIRLEQVTIGQKSEFAGKTIRESEIGARTGAIILAVGALDGRTINNPSGIHVLEPWEKLIVMGKPDQIDAVRKLAEV